MRNMKTLIGLGVAGLVVVGALIGAPAVLERVDAGSYKVTQSLGGDLNVLGKPGWQYTGLLSLVDEYKVGGTYHFSTSPLDGGKGKESDPIAVIFRDGTKAIISGSLQFKLPTDDATRVKIHELYGRNYNEVVNVLIMQTVAEAVKQSSAFFKGEEAYTYRRAEFVSMIEKQLANGIYAQATTQKIVKDAEGNEFMETFVNIKKDANGVNIIEKRPKFGEFNVEIISLTIKDVDLDRKAMELIAEKKDAEFRKIAARSRAEEAKQATITAQEDAKAKVAQAKAQEDVETMKQVAKAKRDKEVQELNAQRDKTVAELNANKNLEVARMNRLTAKEQADAVILTKTAEAKANDLLVKAGLTPKEKAEIEMQTKIGVARELSKVNVPRIVVGGSGEGSASPMDAIGIQMLMNINDKLAK
ncbi:MAG: SPFH domain-containing protein [Paraclostridium sp.]